MSVGLRIADKKQSYKRYIFKIFGFGLLADFIGSAFILLMMIVFSVGRRGDEWYLTLPALLISAAMIFILNYRFTFRQLDKPLRWKLALSFAMATAPYTFFVPTSWVSG